MSNWTWPRSKGTGRHPSYHPTKCEFCWEWLQFDCTKTSRLARLEMPVRGLHGKMFYMAKKYDFWLTGDEQFRNSAPIL